MTLHGALPDEASTGRVAIVVQPAGEEYSVSLRLEAFGLTAREREVATCVGIVAHDPLNAEGHLQAPKAQLAP